MNICVLHIKIKMINKEFNISHEQYHRILSLLKELPYIKSINKICECSDLCHNLEIDIKEQYKMLYHIYIYIY